MRDAKYVGNTANDDGPVIVYVFHIDEACFHFIVSVVRDKL